MDIRQDLCDKVGRRFNKNLQALKPNSKSVFYATIWILFSLNLQEPIITTFISPILFSFFRQQKVIPYP